MAKKAITPAEVVPWVGLVVAAIGAIVKAVIDYKAAEARLEMQKEQIKFMREMAARGPYVDPRCFTGPPTAGWQQPPGIPANPMT